MFHHRLMKLLFCLCLAAPVLFAQHEGHDHEGHDHADHSAQQHQDHEGHDHEGHDHNSHMTQDQSQDSGVDTLQDMQPKVQKMLRNKQYKELSIYLERHLGTYEGHAGVWFQYGYAHHMLGNYKNSFDAWKKAKALGHPSKVILHFNLACAASMLGQIDEGIKYLDQAADLGADPNMMATDSDLANLRKDERFAAILAKAKGEQ